LEVESFLFLLLKRLKAFVFALGEVEGFLLLLLESLNAFVFALEG
jgi:hypothetical protein